MNTPHRILTLLLALAMLLAAHTPALAEKVTYTITGQKELTTSYLTVTASGSATGTTYDSWNINSTSARTITLPGSISLSFGSDKTTSMIVEEDILTIYANGSTGGYITLSHESKYIYHVTLKDGSNNVIHEAWNMTKSFTYRFQAIYVKTIEVEYATAIPITDAEISGIDNSYYVSNTAVTPEPTVTWHGTTLTKGTHYTVDYQNNTTAGTATVMAKGKGKFSSSTSVSANYTLEWATYTVHFEKNDNAATGTMSDQNFTYNTAQNLTANGFSRTNYIFAGWSTTPNGAVEYTDGQSVSNLSATHGATVTLYAQWIPRYTFANGVLTLNGGVFNKDNKWGSDVDPSAVTSVTATNQVSFTGDCSYLFRNFINCTSIDLSQVITDALTHTIQMFYKCESLTSLNLSGWNTANVTHMEQMFYNCTSLESLVLSGWNTANVTDMNHMFYSCSSLQSLDLSGWNTAKVTNMSYMFKDCSSLESLNLSGWNTANVTDMSAMFFSCSIPQSLDISGWNTAKVTDMSYMFSGCSIPQSLDISGWNTENVTDMHNMFNSCSIPQSLDISGWNTANVTNMSYMFKDCSSLESLNLSGWNTAKVTNMNYMFDRCTNLQSLDLSGWNTEKVKFMNCMFNNCTSLTTIYVGTGWSITTEASFVFTYCIKLKGGNGTTYDSNHTNQVYARIDKGPNSDQPGYLTGVFALTLGEGITATPAATLTHGDVKLYAYGRPITLTYSGSVPAGDVVVYSVNGIGIEGDSFEMPDEDVTVKVQSVGRSKSVSVEQATIFGEEKHITSFYDIVPYQLPTGALAYTASLDGGQVVFHRIGENSDIIPANTAVIIVADASAVKNGMITLTKLDSASGITAHSGNILQGSDEPVEVTGGQIGGKTVYVLGKDSSGTLGFYPFSGTSIPAGKAYYVAQ